ncbi:hypothetical protein [Chryseobacterium lacus]|uniref:hypothetical protein n=1 Tax=Chryseobacterium lacus TaxID=2058346 RepID=UPI000F8642CF|nr:hypothetical protein [Chryseobacterium lacus]RST29336.1 hypothetical protein EIZ46_01320 [Chryseobacterium lacus]
MKVKLFLIFSVFVFTSMDGQLLSRILAGKTGVESIKILEKDDKRIIYIPTMHIERPEYYSKIKKYVDSVRDEGYVIFYEGLAFDENTKKEDREILQFKLRKLLGYHIHKTSSEENKSSPKFYKNRKRINQTEADLGIKPDDVRADMTINKLIQEYEKKYGSLKLTACDLKTPLNSKYKCKDDKEFLAKGSAVFTVSHEFRDAYLMQLILNSNEKKILLLYGKAHWLLKIYPTLFDEGYKLVYGKV